MSEREPDRSELLAHDIRAAVSDVIGGLRLIEPDDLTEAARAQVGRVHAASELLARLVEELLHDAPATTPVPGALNLARFLDDELRRWHGAARPTGTTVVLDRAPGLPEVVRLDGLHLRRILANLMGNALRHAPGGTVTLAAEVREDGALALHVGDDGPGFPSGLLPRLFEPATRGGAVPGTGMGLHIAAAHAEGLGGLLSAGNLPGGGAQVTLTVPDAVWRLDAPGGGGLADLTGRRVLVADDSDTNRALLRGMLAKLGAECEVAPDGVEALNWFARERFDLALVDLEMPRLGGLEVIRSERLRQARGVAPPMAMVAMTAYVLRDNREAILAAGADGILSKPLPDVETIGQALAGWLADLPAPEAWSPEMAPPLNAALLAELMGAAGAGGTELLDRLRADLATVSERLERTVETGDLAAMRDQTHVLLSLAGTVGALPTREAAARLGRLARAGDVAAAVIAAKACLGRLGEMRALLDAAGG